jgi:hypothetical protein
MTAAKDLELRVFVIVVVIETGIKAQAQFLGEFSQCILPLLLGEPRQVGNGPEQRKANNDEDNDHGGFHAKHASANPMAVPTTYPG